jgi:hypothetical protein
MLGSEEACGSGMLIECPVDRSFIITVLADWGDAAALAGLALAGRVKGVETKTRANPIRLAAFARFCPCPTNNAIW